MGRKQVGLTAAAVAFYGMLALFPALSALVAVWAIFADPIAVRDQAAGLAGIVPGDIFAIIESQLVSLASASSDTLGWAGLLSLALALWSSRTGVGAIMQSLNRIYDEEDRSALAHQAVALGLTGSLVFVALATIAGLVAAPVALGFVPLGPIGSLAAEVVRWALLFGVMMIGAGVLYRYAPNRRQARLPWITPGAVVAVALWIAVSAGFSIYLAAFDSYNKTYGSLGAVIAMLMWLYLSSFLLLLGGALNAEIERRTRPDSTVGPPRPMGERGAVAADTYAGA